MEAITREWLEKQGACGPDLQKTIRGLGGHVPVSWETLESARQLGVNVLWLVCHMASDRQRRGFVAFTLTQRLPAVERLLGAPPPARESLREAAADAWRLWTETEEPRARSQAVTLREMARDIGVTAPSAQEAEEAALAAQRAISYAGLNQEAAAGAQLDWLAERLIPEG